MSDVYLREIDRRFAPVVEQVIARARLKARERVLDLGTGTGAVAERAAQLVGPEGPRCRTRGFGGPDSLSAAAGGRGDRGTGGT
jgi:trans-aconitate methyltransferase